MEALGLIPAAPGAEHDAWLPCAWDKDPEFVPGPYDNQGDVRETDKGLETKLHPVALLASEPLLWSTVSRWNAGQQELTEQDYATLSAFELSAKRTMVAARARFLRARHDGTGGGS
ncbi:MAG: hypothetical protein IPG45_05925 [Deltaproteobacteria bacterium]|nr:hypothetical protein [Deltaproteobacteria bacterium]